MLLLQTIGITYYGTCTYRNAFVLYVWYGTVFEGKYNECYIGNCGYIFRQYKKFVISTERQNILRTV